METTDNVLGSSVTATVVDTVRRVMFAGAVFIPMALLAVADGFETNSNFTSAGELWLDVRNRMQVATERIL